MAAIDKLYIHSYYEFNDLRNWAIAYFPELLFYFYDAMLSYEAYINNRKEWLIEKKSNIQRDKARFGNYNTKEQAIQNLIDYYKRTANYSCPYEQAKEEIEYTLTQLQKGDFELEDDYTFLVMNTPLKVDRILKWRCPVPCVRKYLHKQCGVNPKYEWLYKLFWKGKKHF